jgi:hypothetical protein
MKSESTLGRGIPWLHAWGPHEHNLMMLCNDHTRVLRFLIRTSNMMRVALELPNSLPILYNKEDH